METGAKETVDVVDGQQGGAHAEHDVQVTVEYLPASAPFHRRYPGATTLETVRTDAMGFFGVRDRQERDTYRYFLEFDRARVTNTSETLDQLLGTHRREAQFNLVEEIKAGTIRG
jgi:hypothetical protein